MDFLLRIRVRFTRDEDPATRTRLLAEEHAHAATLLQQGHLVRLWRTPGQSGNWSIWHAADATHLHALLSALPLYPWMHIRVHPLAQHPLEQPAAAAPAAGPVTLFVTYSGEATARFDRDHYTHVHLPLVRELWGPYGLLSAAALYPATADDATLAVAICQFSSRAAADAALAAPPTDRIMADVAHFTDATPVRSFAG